MLNHPVHSNPSWSSSHVPLQGPWLSFARLLPPQSAQATAKMQKEKENLFTSPAHGEKVWGANYRLMHQSHQ